eukprot:2237045-Rhodomonas_salina.1
MVTLWPRYGHGPGGAQQRSLAPRPHVPPPPAPTPRSIIPALSTGHYVAHACSRIPAHSTGHRVAHT